MRERERERNIQGKRRNIVTPIKLRAKVRKSAERKAIYNNLRERSKELVCFFSKNRNNLALSHY